MVEVTNMTFKGTRIYRPGSGNARTRGRLSDEFRLVIADMYKGGKHVSDIAADTRVPIGTIHSALRKDGLITYTKSRATPVRKRATGAAGDIMLMLREKEAFYREQLEKVRAAIAAIRVLA